MSQSDQTEVQPQTEEFSNDEDSTMEDVGIVDTPRTMSFAPSESQDASEESTRASTPTENRADQISEDINSLNHIEHNNVDDDVTMKDADPEKNLLGAAADNLGGLKFAASPPTAVIDSVSSPLKAKNPKEEIVVHHYHSDPEKDDLLRFNDAD